MENTGFVRQVAVKAAIRQLLLGTYVQEGEQNPNYLLTRDNQKIYRLNLMATILHREMLGSITNLLLDDGTGKIALRAFEEDKYVKELKVGDVISVMGRVRVYNQEKYISPEIIRKISPLWLKVRALELKEVIKQVEEVELAEDSGRREELNLEPILDSQGRKEEIVGEEEIVEEVIGESNLKSGNSESKNLPFNKLVSLIQELDKGEGVLIEELIDKSPLKETDKLIAKMLEKGDIFQNLPGKVKVL